MTVLRWIQRGCAAAGRLPIASLLLGGLAVLIHYSPLPAALNDLLQYDCVAIDQGEWFRLLSCHWTHWSSSHLLWDVVAFVALAAICEAGNRKRMLACIVVSMLTIPLAVHAWQPEMIRYRGLSGVDSSLFGLLAIQMLHDNIRERRWTNTAVVAGITIAFAMKIAIEIATGGAVFVRDGRMIPVPLAHIVGAATGCLIYILDAGRLAVVSMAQSIASALSAPPYRLDR